ncbi:MAG TPA: hypothetical protein VEX40_16520, partial [Mycobacterium sp.]|nr:hypothetical protein [Mycobacterium sp.]
MVRKIIEHRDVLSDADGLEPAFDTSKSLEPLGQCPRADTQPTANGNGGQGVSDVVNPEERRFERTELLAALEHREVRDAVSTADIDGPPHGVALSSERLYGADRVRKKTSC